ncbi:hypothetical protein ACXR0M_16925 [Pseudomonas sp. Eth.TT006]
MSTNKSIGIFALPLTIDWVGADGVLPADAYLNGVTLRIPPWPAPSVIRGNSDLLEIWIREPGATSETLFYIRSFPVPVAFPTSIHLPAQYLQQVGSLTLRYRVTMGDNGNHDDSIPQSFILQRQVPVDLKEVVFPNATFWGYLICSTKPAIWEVVVVRVPAQPGRFLVGDECELKWEGFESLNGVGVIEGTALLLRKNLTEQDVTSTVGFDFKLESPLYAQHIKPIEYGSSSCIYTLFRKGVVQAKSHMEIVKIDRRRPGTSPCGP